MKITGIICEYNPLHAGHKKQLDHIRSIFPDGGIVCLMSGNYVQRGQPAIIDKMHRAEAAVRCGGDLVLELPVTAALSSAEGFAARGVEILSGFCHNLCFGAETADKEKLLTTANLLLSTEFSHHLHKELEKGCSFPAARQAALENMGVDGSILQTPNNILAVEYCKAILAQNSTMEVMPISRKGSYHDTTPDIADPSATAVRQLMNQSGDWSTYVPREAAACFEDMALHTLAAGEKAILGKLRTMTDQEFEALPYGSEGLWRKLMHAARKEATLEDIIAATKSKRYTRTRLDRMLLCAYLGITDKILSSPAPYVRVLAFNDRGRQILKNARQTGDFRNIGEEIDHPYQQLENRCADLYGLFSATPESRKEKDYRVYYHK